MAEPHATVAFDLPLNLTAATVWDNPPVFGLQYQPRLESSIEHRAVGIDLIDCIEVRAEHFSHTTPHRLRWLASQLPLLLRVDTLSLGGPDPLDEHRVAACAAAVRHASARWMVHPVGFTSAGEIDLGLTMPVAPTPANVERVADRARRVVERCGVPLFLEPPASHLRLAGTLAESEFLNQICVRAECGLAIDAAVVCARGTRHGVDPSAWLDGLDAARIGQVRLTLPDGGPDGSADGNPRGPVDCAVDSAPAAATFDAQLELVRRVLRRATPEAFIVTASADVPVPELARALATLQTAVAHADAAPRFTR